MGIALLLQQTAPISRDQLRNEIRQTVHDATQAAQQAAQEAAADAKAAQAQAGGHNIVIPVPPVPPGQSGTLVYGGPETIPPQVEDISLAFFAMIAIIIVGLPLARAFARRIDRGTPPPAQIPRALTDQLQQISQSVDAIAIEVERISEGQRFTTKMLADRPNEGTMISPSSMSGQ